MNRRAWLRCVVSDGMFPNEVAVSIETVAGSVSLFADSAVVRYIAGEAALAVTVIDEDEEYSLVRLPTTPFESPSVVKVKKL